MKKFTKLTAIASLFVSGSLFAQCADISAAGVWDFVKTGTNPVTATIANPLSGTCSMEVPIAAGKRYVQDDMSAESSIRFTFQIDPETMDTPTSGQQRKIKVLNMQCAAGACSSAGYFDWWQAKLRKNADGYKLGFFAREKDGTKLSNTYALVDGCNTIEVQLVAGNPGTYKVWVNNSTEGSPDVNMTPNFDTMYADIARMGRMGVGTRINENATGEHFTADTYESRRQTFIGNTCL